MGIYKNTNGCAPTIGLGHFNLSHCTIHLSECSGFTVHANHRSIQPAKKHAGKCIACYERLVYGDAVTIIWVGILQ